MAIFSKKTKADDKSKKVKTDAEKEALNKDVKKESMKEMYAKNDNKGTGGGSGTRKYGNAYRILIKPMITEKASIEAVHNKYYFEVARNTNKIEIAKAIEEVYGIKPISVNIINMDGKNVRYGRISGKRKDWKKAIVTLPEGKTINLYEGV